MLATAAVSLSPNLVDLPIAGAEVVRTAFRLGVVVDQVSQNLQPRELTDSGTPDTWAYVIPDVTPERVQKELDVIHTNEVCSPLFLSPLHYASTLYPTPHLLYLYPLPQYTIITFPRVSPTSRGTDVAMTENARGKQNLHQRSQQNLGYGQRAAGEAEACLSGFRLLPGHQVYCVAGLQWSLPCPSHLQ